MRNKVFHFYANVVYLLLNVKYIYLLCNLINKNKVAKILKFMS